VTQDDHAERRIYHEVLKGIVESPDDSEVERAYRAQVAREVKEIRDKGGSPEPWDEF
jgi:hypothetical protein